MHRQSIAICYGFYCTFIALSITTFLFTCNWVSCSKKLQRAIVQLERQLRKYKTIDQLTPSVLSLFRATRLALGFFRLELYHLYMARPWSRCSHKMTANKNLSHHIRLKMNTQWIKVSAFGTYTQTHTWDTVCSSRGRQRGKEENRL